jgi:AraC-like DNA-binding protein
VYREYRPPGAIAEIVECFWRREGAPSSGGESTWILPDGRVDIVWTTVTGPLVAGPQTRALERPLRGPFVAIGVRFHPGVGPALLGVPGHELVDAHVPLAAIDTPAAKLLSAELAAAEDPADALRKLGAVLGKLIDAGVAGDPLVGHAAQLLDRPAATVGEVATEVALSERQLHRRFRDRVGYGPKTLQRVLRFQRFLDQLDRDPEHPDGLALIAASLGYADQAHLTRESRELSGLSPVELERLWLT